MKNFNKNAQVLPIIIVIGIIALFGGVYYYSVNYGGKQTFLPDAGCVNIPNPSYPPNSPNQTVYTEALVGGAGSSYVCGADPTRPADKCIIWGAMNVVPITGNLLIYKPGDTNVQPAYFSMLSNGYWKKFVKGSSYTTGCYGVQEGRTSTGSPIMYYSSRWIICAGSYHYYYTDNGASDVSRIPTGAVGEVTAAGSYIDAFFNLCNSANPTFPYCGTTKGTASEVLLSGVKDTSDNVIRINSGQSIAFYPTNADGSTITDKTLFVIREDCTQPTSSQTCTPGSIRCLGATCPPGKITGGYYCNSGYCSSGLNGVDCTPPRYNQYQVCDGFHPLGVNNRLFPWWNTTGTCPTGQLCYLTGTQTNGLGLGGCGCPSSVCTIGQIRRNADGSFNRCINTANGCTDWGNQENCDVGLTLTFTNSSGYYCTCDGNVLNLCTPQTSQCIGSGNRYCLSSNTIVDSKFSNVLGGIRNCPIWDNIIACGANQICNSSTGRCTCINQCSLGSVVCQNENSYYNCIVNENNCYIRDTVLTQVPTGSICQNNQIIQSPRCPYTPCTNNDTKCDTNTGNCICKTPTDDSNFCIANSPNTCDANGYKTTCTQSTNGCWKLTKQTPIPTDYYCSNGEYIPITSGNEYCKSGDSNLCVSGNDGVIKECKATGTGAFKYVLKTLSSEKMCLNNAETCRTTGAYCTQGTQPSCKTSTVANTCIRNPTGSCYINRDVDCSLTNQLCSGGTCASFGCGIPNVPDATTWNRDYKCSDLNDANNVRLENCTSNKCTANVDIYSATLDDYSNAKTKCIGNSIYKVTKYTTKQDIYRWELDVQCGGQTPLCIE